MFSLLPPNATPLEKNVAQLGNRLSALPVPFLSLHRVDQCPAAYLPWLAWDQRVAFWRPEWTEAHKRSAIAEAVAFNAQRGTRPALQVMLDQQLDSYQLTAWHEQTPKNMPFTFIVKVPEPVELTLDQLTGIHNAVDMTKSQRDHYAIEATVKIDTGIYAAGMVVFGESIFLSTPDP